MTIKRNINGQEIEIELTYAEELEIFNNWKTECAKEDCEWQEEYAEQYGITKDEYEELLPEIAEQFLKNQEMDADMEYDRDNAIETILGGRKNG